MTRFLFWNLKRKELQEFIAELATTHGIDVLIFAECEISPASILLTLNRSGSDMYDYAASIGCEKIKIFTRFHRSFIPAILETSRLTVRHLRLPGLIDILLAATHLPSKLHWRESSQSAECINLANSIRQAEEVLGHSRTILVGDFNMSPFEDGVVNANGLHGVMSRRIATRRTRIVQDREYAFFYNPMWGLLGDASSDPPGTYYFSSAEHNSLFWHMFDQVLVRPDLMEKFNNASLRIVKSVGEIPFLLPSGMPDQRLASDHLPILFDLNL